MAEGTITSSIGTQVYINDTYKLTNIQSIGELQSDPGQIDVTTLEDKEYRYIPAARQVSGISIVCFKEAENYGNYEYLKAMEQCQKVYGKNQLTRITIIFPDATSVHFNAKISVKLNAIAVNGAVTFTLSLFKIGEFSDGSPINDPIHSSGYFESYDDIWLPQVIYWARYTDGRVRLYTIPGSYLLNPSGGALMAEDTIVEDTLPIAIHPLTNQALPIEARKGPDQTIYTAQMSIYASGQILARGYLNKVPASGGEERIYLDVVYQGPVPTP